jgi:LysR family transcriptional regulator, transcription activator of glutamate synthase operon
MDMDTEALRWFQQVADGVTVTEVGELYRVTQSGVSRGLARLEAQVGTPLLRRSGRTLRMTPAGAAFKRHVDALLNDLDDGLAAVTQLIEPDTGTVSVAFQLSLGTWLVPALVSGFRTAHPQVSFTLKQTRDELVSAVLSDGRVDLEITTLRQTDPNVRWHRLLSEPLCLTLAAGHPLAARTRSGSPARVDLADVRDEPFVTLRPASLLRRLGATLCERAGFEPRTAFEGDDLPTVRGLVAAGLGVAIMPAPHLGDPETRAGPLVYLPIDDPAAVREIGLAWSAERRLLPAAELFHQHVVDTAKARRLPA